MSVAVVTVGRDPEIWFQGGSNDCGPYSLAMAADCVAPGSLTPVRALSLLRRLRLPFVGATPPWSIAIAARIAGFSLRGHLFGTIDDIRSAVSRGQPCLVIVRPDEFVKVKWYALHYRVVLGYRDDSECPGGGEFYFACSATPRSLSRREHPGNLTIDYATFRRQWQTWLIPRWYGAITAPGLRQLAS